MIVPKATSLALYAVLALVMAPTTEAVRHSQVKGEPLDKKNGEEERFNRRGRRLDPKDGKKGKGSCEFDDEFLCRVYSPEKESVKCKNYEDLFEPLELCPSQDELCSCGSSEFDNPQKEFCSPLADAGCAGGCNEFICDCCETRCCERTSLKKEEVCAVLNLQNTGTSANPDFDGVACDEYDFLCPCDSDRDEDGFTKKQYCEEIVATDPPACQKLCGDFLETCCKGEAPGCPAGRRRGRHRRARGEE